MSKPSKLPAEVGIHLPFIYMPIAAVKAAVGLSSSTIYVMIARGEFPAGDLISSQIRRWKSSDIANWLQQRAAAAAGQPGLKSAKVSRIKSGADHATAR